MSVLDAVRNLNNQTEWQRLQDRNNQIEESMERGRNVGGNMGKNDFLMLLSAQLRHQDPLEPSSDADFAAQLAQFTSLEQMQNMNTSMESLVNMQSYGLVGKFVIAEQVVNGQVTEIAGEVDSIFVRDGVTFAQIGEDTVPLSAIREVFNTSNLLTSDRLLQTSQSLIGREVLAVVGDDEITGVVQRIVVNLGTMYAQLDTLGDDGEPIFVPVNSIVDIGLAGSQVRERPTTPPDAQSWRRDENGVFFEIEVTANGSRDIGRWDWNEAEWRWVLTKFETENTGNTENNEPPSAAPPPTDKNPPKNENPYGDGYGSSPGNSYDTAA